MKSDASNAKSSKISSKFFNGLKFAFATKEFNPKRWLKGELYDHGSVLKTALSNAKTLYGKPDVKRRESFQEACERLNLTDADLDLRYRDSVISSRGCNFIAVLLIFFSAYHAFTGNIAGGIGGLMMVAVALVCGLQRSYLAWRISIRQLAPLSAFLKTPEAWFV